MELDPTVCRRAMRSRDARFDGRFFTGVITTVAGTGAFTYNGDDILATSANIRPSGLALDGLGNLFIAESSNSRVRRVDGLTGMITTVAGTGVSAATGDDGDT